MKPEFIFDAIGTKWTINILDSITAQELENLYSQIQDIIEEFDCTYSRFREDSLVTKMSRDSGIYPLPKNSEQLLKVYKNLYHITNGLFTPLIGNLLEEAGYDANYSLTPKKLHAVKSWDEVLEFDNKKIRMKKPALLDFGAGGKGYLVDLVGEEIQKNGIKNYCIDSGGDILYKNTSGQKLKVGLEHPSDPDKVIGVAEILNQSICGSAGNRRKWGDFHHIVNPKTLVPVKDILAVWVIADTALLADALATCLFFVDHSKLKEYAFDYVLIRPDYTLEKSRDFPGEFYYN